MNKEQLKKQKTDPVALLQDPTVAAISLMQAARTLGICRSTAYNVAPTGQLCEGVPIITIGRRYIVSTHHLRAALGIPDPIPA